MVLANRVCFQWGKWYIHRKLSQFHLGFHFQRNKRTMPSRIYFCHLLEWVFMFFELPCLLMKTVLQTHLSPPTDEPLLPCTCSLSVALLPPLPLSLLLSPFPPLPPLSSLLPPIFFSPPSLSVSLLNLWFCTALQWVLCKETWLFLLPPSATMSYPWRDLPLVLMWRTVGYAPVL